MELFSFNERAGRNVSNASEKRRIKLLVGDAFDSNFSPSEMQGNMKFIPEIRIIVFLSIVRIAYKYKYL